MKLVVLFMFVGWGHDLRYAATECARTEYIQPITRSQVSIADAPCIVISRGLVPRMVIA